MPVTLECTGNLIERMSMPQLATLRGCDQSSPMSISSSRKAALESPTAAYVPSNAPEDGGGCTMEVWARKCSGRPKRRTISAVCGFSENPTWITMAQHAGINSQCDVLLQLAMERCSEAYATSLADPAPTHAAASTAKNPSAMTHHSIPTPALIGTSHAHLNEVAPEPAARQLLQTDAVAR